MPPFKDYLVEGVIMKKKNILIISIIIILILGGIALLRLINIQVVRETLPKDKTASYQEVIKLKDGRIVYSKYQDNTNLKAKLEENNNYLDDLVKSLNNKVILKDGGSIVYKKNDIYIVMCHRIGSLDADKTIEDIYLGDTYQDVCLE